LAHPQLKFSALHYVPIGFVSVWLSGRLTDLPSQIPCVSVLQDGALIAGQAMVLGLT